MNKTNPIGDILEFTINTKYTSKNPIRENKKSEIFPRVFKILSEEGKNPGIINLILIKDNEDYRVLGAFTQNTGGSISFFPDFSNKLTTQYYALNEVKKTETAKVFDHITLNKDFSKRAHITNIDGKHFSKHDPISIDPDHYSWLTITITDISGLNDFSGSEKVALPVKYYTPEQYVEIINKSLSGTFAVEFPTTPMSEYFRVLQISLLKKGTLDLPDKFLDGVFKLDIFEGVNTTENILSNNLLLETSNGFDYNIVISVFNLKGKPKDDILIVQGTLNIQNPGF